MKQLTQLIEGSLFVQVLTEKNTQLSQELEECKAQLRAAVAALKESEKAPSGNTCFYCKE